MRAHASPSVNVSGLQRAAVTAAESAPTTAANFTNFWTSYVDARNGLIGSSAITTALIPDWQKYDRGRFLFHQTLNSGTITSATVTVYQYTPEGVIRVLGQVDLNADDVTYDPFEFDIEAGATYAVRVTAIAGSTPNIDIDVSAQGFYLND